MVISNLNVQAKHTSDLGSYDVNFSIYNGKLGNVSATLYNEGEWLASVSKDSSNLNINCATAHDDIVDDVIKDFNAIYAEASQSEYIVNE